jgi:ABC-2 type transport system ATP-binding protein
MGPEHNTSEVAVEVAGLTHRYGERLALDALSFSVGVGEIYGLLGPNGGGKTTLFQLLSSLMHLQAGTVSVFGLDLATSSIPVRRTMGVAFQSPSLDVHLTVAENLRHQGHLYRMRGAALEQRIVQLLERFGLADRTRDRVAELSGGLQRRVEIAKALIHQPRLLVLDEPSTGLDPGIRREMWSVLEELREQDGVTVLLTTHFMEEGDRCDRVGLLDQGRMVAEGAPAELKTEVGGDVVRITSDEPGEVVEELRQRFAIEARFDGEVVRFERQRAHTEVVPVVEALAERITSISVSQPTLEDVFLARTGHGFWEGAS